MARRARQVRLGQPFAIAGDHLVYSEIRFPPLHPSCQCTVVEVLKPEYGGPENPQWAETLKQPKPEAQDAAPDPTPPAAAARARRPDGPREAKPETAIRRASKIAADHGVETITGKEADELLWIKFNGDPFLINNTIAYYDEDEDAIVINQRHEAWSRIKSFMKGRRERSVYSTGAPDHIIRHEIGHALHYRGMTDAERAEIWYKPLTDDEARTAAKVSTYATNGRIEFVADVFAARWSRVKLPDDVLQLYERLKGPTR